MTTTTTTTAEPATATSRHTPVEVGLFIHQHGVEVQPFGTLRLLPDRPVLRGPAWRAASGSTRSWPTALILYSPVQEAPLAHAGPHLLPAAPAARQARRRAARADRPDRRTGPDPGRRGRGRPPPRRRDHHHPPAARTAPKRCRPCSPGCSRRTRSSSPRCATPSPATTANRDDGTNDLLVGDVLRRHELQVWFLAEHLVDTPVTRA